MEKYKTLNVKLLTVYIETTYFKFIGKSEYIYKYLSIFETMGRVCCGISSASWYRWTSCTFGAIYSWWLSDW